MGSEGAGGDRQGSGAGQGRGSPRCCSAPIFNLLHVGGDSVQGLSIAWAVGGQYTRPHGQASSCLQVKAGISPHGCTPRGCAPSASPTGFPEGSTCLLDSQQWGSLSRHTPVGVHCAWVLPGLHCMAWGPWEGGNLASTWLPQQEGGPMPGGAPPHHHTAPHPHTTAPHLHTAPHPTCSGAAQVCVHMQLDVATSPPRCMQGPAVQRRGCAHVQAAACMRHANLAPSPLHPCAVLASTLPPNGATLAPESRRFQQKPP